MPEEFGEQPTADDSARKREPARVEGETLPLNQGVRLLACEKCKPTLKFTIKQEWAYYFNGRLTTTLEQNLSFSIKGDPFSKPWDVDGYHALRRKGAVEPLETWNVKLPGDGEESPFQFTQSGPTTGSITDPDKLRLLMPAVPGIAVDKIELAIDQGQSPQVILVVKTHPRTSGFSVVPSEQNLAVAVEVLKADPGGPYTVVRGEKLTLDGSHSEGKIESYEWTFTPKPNEKDSEITPAAEFRATTKSGKEPSMKVQLLCDTEVVLRVFDSKGNNSDCGVLVNVTPRKFKTDFKHSDETPDGFLPEGVEPPLYTEGGHVTAAINLCLHEPMNTPKDYEAYFPEQFFHPRPTKKGDGRETWDEHGYKLGQVEDPGGPFDQWWYVKDYSMVVHRRIVNNRYFPKGGPLPHAKATENFYDANLRKGHDVDRFLKETAKHERLHSDRMQQFLKEQDPAWEVEKLFSKKRDDLRDDTDSEISKAKKGIAKFAGDARMPLTWNGKLALFDPSLIVIGDRWVDIDAKVGEVEDKGSRPKK